MGKRKPRHPAVVAVLTAGAALVLVACTSSSGPGAVPSSSAATTTAAAPPPSAPPATTTTTAPTASTDAAVEAGFDAAAEAYVLASAAADPQHPALLATHTGPMLERRQQGLTARRADGEVGVRDPRTSWVVEDITIDPSGTVARLAYCAVDHDRVVRAADGQVVDDAILTVRGRASLQLVDGRWLLAERVADLQQEGDQGCDATS